MVAVPAMIVAVVVVVVAAGGGQDRGDHGESGQMFQHCGSLIRTAVGRVQAQTMNWVFCFAWGAGCLEGEQDLSPDNGRYRGQAR
ncbi:hypothetical protein D3C80_1679100 [compost metagenome]